MRQCFKLPQIDSRLESLRYDAQADCDTLPREQRAQNEALYIIHGRRKQGAMCTACYNAEIATSVSYAVDFLLLASERRETVKKLEVESVNSEATSMFNPSYCAPDDIGSLGRPTKRSWA